MLKSFKEKITKKKQKKDALDFLASVYGEHNAKIIINQIQQIKDKNPNKAYSFVFKEDGTFQAIEKDFEEKEKKEE